MRTLGTRLPHHRLTNAEFRVVCECIIFWRENKWPPAFREAQTTEKFREVNSEGHPEEKEIFRREKRRRISSNEDERERGEGE